MGGGPAGRPAAPKAWLGHHGQSQALTQTTPSLPSVSSNSTRILLHFGPSFNSSGLKQLKCQALSGESLFKCSR